MSTLLVILASFVGALAGGYLRGSDTPERKESPKSTIKRSKYRVWRASDEAFHERLQEKERERKEHT